MYPDSTEYKWRFSKFIKHGHPIYWRKTPHHLDILRISSKERYIFIYISDNKFGWTFGDRNKNVETDNPDNCNHNKFPQTMTNNVRDNLYISNILKDVKIPLDKYYDALLEKNEMAIYLRNNNLIKDETA